MSLHEFSQKLLSSWNADPKSTYSTLRNDVPPLSLKGVAKIIIRTTTLHRPSVDSGVVEQHEEDVRAADTRIGVAIQGAFCPAGHPRVSGGVHLHTLGERSTNA